MNWFTGNWCRTVFQTVQSARFEKPSYTRVIAGATILLTALLLVGGCSPREGVAPTKTEPDEEPPQKGYTRFAPQGQHTYHADLKIDKDAKKATVLVLDKQGRNPVPTKAETFTLTIKNGAPVQITLNPERQEKDPPGKASRFTSAPHDRLATPVENDKLEISGTVEGRPYVFSPEKD